MPWAEPRIRFTGLLERLIIDLILQCSTVKGACEIAGVSWDEAWGVMSRAVARGHARKEATLSRRGQHLDVTLRRPPRVKRLHLIIDSTGLAMFGEGEARVGVCELD